MRRRGGVCAVVIDTGQGVSNASTTRLRHGSASRSEITDRSDVGPEIEIRVERLAFGGGAVGRGPDGRIVFVRGAVPGDRVRVRVIESKRRFIRGRMLEVIEPSPDRIDLFCPHGLRCGGCPWMAAPTALQRRSLFDHLERSLGRATPFNGTLEAMIPAEPTVGWRSTARLHWFEARWGYHAHNTRQIVDAETCPALEPALGRLHGAVRERLTPELVGSGELRMTAAPGATSGTIVVAPRQNGPCGREAWIGVVRRFVAESTECHGAVLEIRASPPVSFGEPLNRITSCAGLLIEHPAQSFIQAHQPGNAKLVRAVVEAVVESARPTSGDLARASVVELYAGSGNFSLPLAEAGITLTVVERDAGAAQALRRVARHPALGQRIRVRHADAAHAPFAGCRTVLLDPPRAGARDVLPRIHGSTCQNVVYVSCEPSTLARDARWMAERGWRLERIIPFDLFPHTGHVEVLLTLRRS